VLPARGDDWARDVHGHRRLRHQTTVARRTRSAQTLSGVGGEREGEVATVRMIDSGTNGIRGTASTVRPLMYLRWSVRMRRGGGDLEGFAARKRDQRPIEQRRVQAENPGAPGVLDKAEGGPNVPLTSPRDRRCPSNRRCWDRIARALGSTVSCVFHGDRRSCRATAPRRWARYRPTVRLVGAHVEFLREAVQPALSLPCGRQRAATRPATLCGTHRRMLSVALVKTSGRSPNRAS